MRLIFLGLIITLFLPVGISFAGTQEYEFAKAYILGIECRKQIETRSTTDLLEAGKDEMKRSMALMRNGQRAIMELQAAINYLTPFQKSDKKAISAVAQNTIENYELMIANYKDSVQALEIMNNPANATNPNIDLGKMMSRVSGITAKQEYISESLFQGVTLAAMALVDLRPDKDGHCSYLLLTTAERKDLISNLDATFGVDIKDGLKVGQNYTLASAAAMRELLAGDHKSSEERK